jgi:predicted phosphodiesterase
MNIWTEPFAVLADIHGNAVALKAVMDDMRSRGIERAVNLGDSFYGPLDPGKTARLLERLGAVTVLGNQDRLVLEPPDSGNANPTLWHVMENLLPSDLERLSQVPPVVELAGGDILCCHGTPEDDTVYLTENTESGRPRPRSCAEMEDRIGARAPSLVLCGHSHLFRVIRCNSMTVVNPGSVGLPAYADDDPPHAMSSGSPHARYAIISRERDAWSITGPLVEYDWDGAAAMALEHGRADWAGWLQSGVAE